jgi:hypothetical protein
VDDVGFGKGGPFDTGFKEQRFGSLTGDLVVHLAVQPEMEGLLAMGANRFDLDLDILAV